MRTPMTTIATLGLALAAGCTQPPPATPVATQPAAPAAARAGMPGAPIEFRVVAASGNPSGCVRFDAALARVHTFTRTGDTASVTSAGGISSAMTQSAPGVFTTKYSLGATTLDVVANTSTSPKRLDVTEPRLGCRWNAVAP